MSPKKVTKAVLKIAERSLKYRIKDVVFGQRVKGERVKPPTFKTTYPDNPSDNQFTWMKELGVTTRAHRKPVHF